MRRVPPVLLVAAFALACAAGCGPKGLREGKVPFPADHPVMVDPDGTEIRGLPAFPEKLTLVVFDFPWCPPCRDAWEAVRAAGVGLPEGTVHVARILFERETIISQGGKSLVPPMREPAVPDVGRLPLTSFRAIPRPFREAFVLDQVPLLLLLDGRGEIVRRWSGYSGELSEELAAEIRNRSSGASPPPGT